MITNKRRKALPLVKLSTISLSVGLGVFLVGCADDKCNDKSLQYAPQSIIDECKKSSGSSGGSRSSSTTILPTSSGYFGSTSSAYHSSGG